MLASLLFATDTDAVARESETVIGIVGWESRAFNRQLPGQALIRLHVTPSKRTLSDETLYGGTGPDGRWAPLVVIGGGGVTADADALAARVTRTMTQAAMVDLAEQLIRQRARETPTVQAPIDIAVLPAIGPAAWLQVKDACR